MPPAGHPGISRHPSQDEYKSIQRLPSLKRQSFAEKKGIYSWSLIVVIPFKLMVLDPENLPEKILVFDKCADDTEYPHFKVGAQ